MKDYLLHMRPRSWPIVAAHCTAGFLCGATMAGSPVLWWRLPLAAVGWGILLNGGTLALNSAFDNDTGAIGYLDDPPPVPAGLAVFGVVLIMSGFAVAAVLGKAYMAAYAVCAVMSALYSCPPVRLKAVAGADMAINCTGYGALTFYSGWAASGAELGAAGWYAVSGFFLLFGALYPLT
ncbi:MAG: hypothetical protein J7M12_05030, partial [Candidatus Hydrogenedentes bacterium]|nr:hypothetical protein [Candidatus Hydrogenedentota bacterium]